MVNIVLHGCNGRMGTKLTELIAEDEDLTVVAGIEPSGEKKYTYPVYKSLNEMKEAADVIIDFSRAEAVDGLLAYCEEKRIPLVLCSTGLSDEQLQKTEELARKSAVLRSANMSLGINLLAKLLKEVSPLLFNNDFDIEIVEKHHRMKLDAPSGTAVLLADAVKESLTPEISYNCNRTDVRKRRAKDEIGISAVRGGTIVGEHEVIFAGEDEVITLSHSAYSRSVFAKGAMAAAKFLKGKTEGYYTMSDVIL